MPDKFYYLESLETIELEGKKSWLNIHRVGTWSHPTYKKIEGSIKKFEKMIANFDNEVIGRKVPMDTRHDHGGALGWVEKLKIVGEKLMALVSWTPLGEKVVKQRIYKYVSPEYDESYEDKETGKKYGPALLAIAATNFPFLTKLEPMALSEDLEKDEELANALAKPEGPKKIQRKAKKSLELTDGELAILNSIKEYEWRKIQEEEEETINTLLDDVIEPLTIPQKRMVAKLQQIIYLPMPNFRTCRLAPPGNFQAGSFRTVTRSSDGKQYSIIMGRPKGKTTMSEQAYRYSKDIWDASSARSHCERHDGNFEA